MKEKFLGLTSSPPPPKKSQQTNKQVYTVHFIDFLFIFHSDNVQNIHPDSEENVLSTRERVRASERVRTNPGGIDCPVCLGNTQYGTETNCGHIFCGKHHFSDNELFLLSCTGTGTGYMCIIYGT